MTMIKQAAIYYSASTVYEWLHLESVMAFCLEAKLRMRETMWRGCVLAKTESCELNKQCWEVRQASRAQQKGLANATSVFVRKNELQTAVSSFYVTSDKFYCILKYPKKKAVFPFLLFQWSSVGLRSADCRRKSLQVSSSWGLQIGPTQLWCMFRLTACHCRTEWKFSLVSVELILYNFKYFTLE